MASKEKAPARIGAKHSRCKRRQFESTVETPYAMVSQSKRTVNVAVVGAGFTILAHVIALVRAGARVVAVCDTDPGLASKLLGKLSGGRLYTNYEMFLEHESKMRTTERPELLVIAVPNALHEEFAMQALKYGFCLDLEKPITTTLRGARRIRAYAKRNDVPIGVPSCYRFDFMLAVLHWLVANGYAGSVLEAYIKYLQENVYQEDPEAPIRLMTADEDCMETDELRFVLGGSHFSEEHHEVTWVAREAVRYLRDERDSSRPFFLNLSFQGPHQPYLCPGEWGTMYDPADIPLPEDFFSSTEG